jgi:hypothetical protein
MKTTGKEPLQQEPELSPERAGYCGNSIFCMNFLVLTVIYHSYQLIYIDM